MLLEGFRTLLKVRKTNILSLNEAIESDDFHLT